MLAASGDPPGLLQLLGGVHRQRHVGHREAADADAGLDQTRVRGSLDRVRGRTPRGPRAETVIEGIGHMDYAISREVRALASEWIVRQLESAKVNVP